jgi:hypothetical protein
MEASQKLHVEAGRFRKNFQDIRTELKVIHGGFQKKLAEVQVLRDGVGTMDQVSMFHDSH